MHSLGEEHRPLAVVDDFALHPEALIAYAENGKSFQARCCCCCCVDYCSMINNVDVADA